MTVKTSCSLDYCNLTSFVSLFGLGDYEGCNLAFYKAFLPPYSNTHTHNHLFLCGIKLQAYVGLDRSEVPHLDMFGAMT